MDSDLLGRGFNRGFLSKPNLGWTLEAERIAARNGGQAAPDWLWATTALTAKSDLQTQTVYPECL